MTPTLPRLADKTDTEHASRSRAEAIKVLCLTALNEGSLITAAHEFVAMDPRGVHTKLLREALDTGELIQKAIAPATVGDLAHAGHLLPPAMLEPLTTRMQQTTVLGRISEPVPPNVPIPYETAAVSLAWVGENRAKPATKLTLASTTVGLFKFSGILVQSRELAKATVGGSSNVIEARLVDASTRFLDAQLFDPALAGVASTNPASLLNGVTPTPPGASLDDTIAALVAAFATARPNATTPMFVASPMTATKIAGTGHNPAVTTTGGTLRGAPLVTTVGAGANLVLLDRDAIFSYDAGAEVAVSLEAAIEMEAAPGSPPTAATVVLPLWQVNCIGFRLDRFSGWTKAPNAVAYTVIA